jgi:hypothetical protein
MSQCPDFLRAYAGPRLALIADSFQRLIGAPLVAPTIDLADALWNAPRVIVAHGTEADPIFFFGNKMALELFEMTPEDFAKLPSRLSAEAMNREERQRLLDEVTRNNFIANYAGVRISATGRRFRIEQAVVWNLLDAQGSKHGQAATFDRWVGV